MLRSLRYSLLAAGVAAACAPLLVSAATEADAPTFGAITPVSVYKNASVTYSVDVTDESNVGSCTFLVNGDSQGAMALTLISGTTWRATKAYTYTGVASNINVQVDCTDMATTPNTGSASQSVTIIVDSTSPSVGAVTPVTATVGTAVVMAATYSDAQTGINSCTLYVDGASQGAMTLPESAPSDAGTATKSYTFTSSGSHTAYVTCTDVEANVGTSATATVTVAASGDTTLPTVTGIAPANATVNVAVTVTANVSDNVGVSSCTLFVGGASQGAMSISAGVASRSHTFTATGNAAVEVRCTDTSGNTGSGSATIVVSAAGVDNVPPGVGMIAQTSATVGVATSLTAAVSDNVAVTACDLYVNGTFMGSMTISGGIASRTHTFSAAGTYSAYARCTDAAGNVGVGAGQNVVVTAGLIGGNDPDADGDDIADIDESVWGTSVFNRDSDADGTWDGTEVRGGTNPTGAGAMIRPTGTPVPGRLIKLTCPLNAAASDPCRAVYYYGRDGLRHAFPSEKIYRTWFNHFLHVQAVDAAFLGSLNVGENALFRPGVRMVKFQTVNTVYAVARGGVLRPISSESVAAGLYGSAWGTMVDDASDILFGNFTIGASINSTADFNAAGATAGTTAIDASF